MAHRVENARSNELAESALLSGNIRATVVSIYGRASHGWRPGEIAHGLREARQLHSRERRAVGELVFQLVRMRRRLAFSAGLDSGEVARPPSDALYLALLAQDGVTPALERELHALSMGPRSFETADARLAAIEDPVRRLALTHSYPDWLVARMLDEAPLEEVDAMLAASNARAPLCARANRLKNDRDELAARLRKQGVDSRPLPLAPDGLELLTHTNAYGLESFKEGRFELQDTASQLVGELTAPPPRGRVLDLCAGAGGKTLHLAALLQGAGRVTSCDIQDDKLEELRKRARRAGCSNVEAKTIERTGSLAHLGTFDRVLVDAPCTGTGVLRRNPEARWRLGPHDVLELPKTQLDLLQRAAPLVRQGGRLVYATCSMLRAEDEDVVTAFLEQHRDFEPVLLKEILGKDRALQIGDGTTLRTYPQRQNADGFFAAVFRKR